MKCTICEKIWGVLYRNARKGEDCHDWRCFNCLDPEFRPSAKTQEHVEPKLIYAGLFKRFTEVQ